MPQSDEDKDEFDYENDQAECGTCFGSGWVDSVSAETGRYFWDTDDPGECPNCRGSGLASDMWYF